MEQALCNVVLMFFVGSCFLIFTAQKNNRLLYIAADFIGCLEKTFHRQNHGYTALVTMPKNMALKTINTRVKSYQC
jgi:hypothetical protein